MAIALGIISGGIRVAAANANDFTYQSLTNLGPCASSRVLLMNNDTNPICPIQGQGYHDTSNTVEVGQTYWWHDDTPFDEEIPGAGMTFAAYINLLDGANHILYHKRESDPAPEKLWELVDCRTGSAATRLVAGVYNYLPWSKTCQPIDAVYSAPISPTEYTVGMGNSNGIRQVSVITMRATTDSEGKPTAKIYSPLYEDGIGTIFFDAVNFMTAAMYRNSHIAVEISYEYASGVEGDDDNILDFSKETDMGKLDWIRVPCEVFKVIKGGGCERDEENDGKTEVVMNSTSGFDGMYYRIRANVNYNSPIRFRIVRTDVKSTAYTDFGDLIIVDNIIASYPTPKATLSPTGIDSEGEGFAKIGRVGAFSEPFLSKGLDTAKPRMTYSAETNGLPPFIDWKASVTNSDFVWRWCYLNQAYGPWTTNEMSLAENGTELVGDSPISVTNRIGDIEYYYVADVAGTHYEFFDFANDTPVPLPAADAGSTRVRYPDTTVEGVSNYWSRIREGVSPWQEMHLESFVITNAEEVLVATNSWTMELISDHTWRGFVFTPTNYAGCVAHIRFTGKNMWESNGVNPSVASQTWYFPIGEVKEIPMGGVATTAKGDREQDIVLDATSGYLMLEFNDESGAFTMNRAEYQDFNKWTPSAGQEENRYIGDYVNTSYVGRAKQEYTLDIGNWSLSRSSSPYWWENFDAMAGNRDYPFDVPFGLNRQTPNGWVASNGMFINGMFSAVTNKTTYGMALQLQGRGLGTLSLIDPADVPQGIGTVSFAARLAQYIEFGDFYYYIDGTARNNYAISAKVAMTNRRKKFSDVSTGSPSLSMVAYYRPGKGCYELRVTRVSTASATDIWAKNGKMELAIYKWSMGADPVTGEYGMRAVKLASNTYTDAEANYLVPPTSGNIETDNATWSSMFLAAYTSGNSTYIEGAVAVKPNSTIAYDDFRITNNKMFVVSFTDTDEALTKGSFGVCTTECPGTFGSIQYHVVSGVGPYKNPSTGVFSIGKFASCPSIGSADDGVSQPWIQRTIVAGDWGSMSPSRIVRWDDSSNEYLGTFPKGLCAGPVSQKVYLSTAPSGNSSQWSDTGLEFTLTNYLAETVVFSPRTTTPANIQISVGGNQSSPRTDVAIDDVQLSQWAGDASVSSDLGSTEKWAFTDAWIAGTTNDVYQGAGSSSDDSVAAITKCGYYVQQINDTEFIYVFTNTTAGALGTYAEFVPKQDMTVKELFVLGAGGGGGPGGGGGGGGNAIWITNDVEYVAGESGIQIYVGNGGSGGGKTTSNMNPANSGSGGTSYVKLKNPLKPSSVQTYSGYGGGAGGAYESGRTNGVNSASSVAGGGGSACKSTVSAKGSAAYASGFGGKAFDGAPGGGGGGGLRGIRPSDGNNSASTSPSSVIFAGTNGMDGTAGANGGKGGDGFPVSALGESEIRYAIAELVAGNKNADVWLGGGGGGGSGESTNANMGKGAGVSGAGGNGGGGQGGQYTAIQVGTSTYDSPGFAQGHNAALYTGGGGGGGSFYNPVSSGGSKTKNWIIGGGAGSGGLVVMHVKIKDRFVMLQPMRGSETDPMSVRTLFLNGISLLSFSWKDAHPDAVLRVQVATNGVDESNIRIITSSLDNGWADFGEPIRFKDMDDSTRAQGSTNILMGLRAPISGIVRLLMDPSVVAAARKGATNELDSLYGTVIVTGMKVFDEPALDDRSWWGWNIMPTYKLEWSSLYDPVTLGPGRSLGLNFTGRLPAGWTVDQMNSKDKESDPENPFFAVKTQDDFEVAEFDKHDPFVQTPRFTNRIGAVMFKARVTETNSNDSGWVTISACADPGEEDDAKWDVLTNIEVTASTTVFEPFLWRIPTSQSNYQALRLTTWGAAEGRYHSEESGQPFGDPNVTTNPTPIQRVLIDEVVVTQPMAPKLSFVNAYPFRHGLFTTNSIPADRITSPDEQPLLGETFGMQVQVLPAGMEDELNADSIRVYMAWYAGDDKWGYQNWKDEKYAVKKVELKRASDWSAGNLVYRSHPDDPNAFIPPQMPGDRGYKHVQYHIWAEYENKNGMEQDPHEITQNDWSRPKWYEGIEDPNVLNRTFCPYTVLDSISPKRAWINEINIFDGNTQDGSNQYIEVAVPSGYDITGWMLESLMQKDAPDYRPHPVATFGTLGITSMKTANATNRYSFIALQSPRTKAAGTHPELNDGVWDGFDGGSIQIGYPHSLRLVRPTGIVEHEIVFMSTNTSTAPISRDTYEGRYFHGQLTTKFPEKKDSIVYAGADAYGAVPAYPGKVMSLGVYKGHGESESCWTNMMQNTPGKVNILADGTLQSIDPKYFEPPTGTNLWIYANIDDGSLNSLSMVIGGVTNTSAVIIVPQGSDGSFSTSIVYVVKKWFELDTVTTNELGRPAGMVTEATGVSRVWTLDLSNLRLSNPESRQFEVNASTRDSSKISGLGDNGIAKDDPYYPAVVDWLQNYEEGEIRLAEYWGSDSGPYKPDGISKKLLNLKQMYWLDIPPVSAAPDRYTDSSEWVFKGYVSNVSPLKVNQVNPVTGEFMENRNVSVKMMISNRLTNVAHAPCTLRGIVPGSTSSNHNGQVLSDWDSVTFKITGMLISSDNRTSNIRRPLRWFTFGPESFTNFTREIEILDPFSTFSPGYSYGWYKYPSSTVGFAWSLGDDTNRPAVKVELLNNESAAYPELTSP